MDQEQVQAQETDCVPLSDFKRLRACMRCHLIKSEKQWKDDRRCENCPFFNDLMEDDDIMKDCTTTLFEGMMAIMKPEQSWVARSQKLNDMLPGMYCLKVYVELPENIETKLVNSGIKILY